MKGLSKRNFLVAMVFLLPCLIALFYLSHSITSLFYRSSVYTDSTRVPENRVALVLGAGLKPDGRPDDILYDRIAAGARLYHAGKVSKILVSGDNRFKTYDEPEAMKKTLIALGVSERDIQPDYAGRRTYDSCWRAKHIFSQDSLIIVTQSFHMTRSLFLCNALGIKSVGYTSDTNGYLWVDWTYWSMRDVIGFTLALIDVYVRHPLPIGGERLPL